MPIRKGLRTDDGCVMGLTYFPAIRLLGHREHIGAARGGAGEDFHYMLLLLRKQLESIAVPR